MNRWLNYFLRYGYPTFLAVVVIAVWEYGTWYFETPRYLLPAPSLILKSFVEDWRLIWINLWPTLTEILVGYLLSIVIGIPLATAIVYSYLAERTLYPPMVASQAIPKVAIAPLFMVWMGYGMMPKIWIAFLIAFFPIVIDSVVGLRSIPPEMIQLGRSMGGGRFRVFIKLRLPHALPGNPQTRR